MTKQKQRLDLVLLEKKFFESRQRAQSAVMSGGVYVNGVKVTKPGTLIATDDDIQLKSNDCIYVSRGGLKLEKAINTFGLNVLGKICLDIGASTGGFTDCLLKNGASFVYAIDVGYGQLDWKIRTDTRVKVLEKTNIRYLEPNKLYTKEHKAKATICTIDVSFISLTKILDNTCKLMDDDKNIVTLIKPQFEAGKNQVQKKGVIRDKAIHYQVLHNIFSFCNTININIVDLTHSPIKGPSGNIEFLALMSSNMSIDTITLDKAMEVVDLAHKELG